MRWPWLCVFFVLAVLAGAGAARAQDAAHGAPFIDRFSNGVDQARWRISDGWSNGEWSANDWVASQVSTTPEGARIVLAHRRIVGAAKRYMSGELQTRARYQYGYFEARLRVPRGSGLVSGFFTYHRPGDENSWREIDIEIIGRNTRQVRVGYFRRGAQHFVVRPLGFDAAEAAHTYGFEWAPRHIRWYVDGWLVHEERGEDLAIPQTPQRLYLHLWNSDTLTDWLGPIRRGEGPWALEVSCVAYATRFERQLCF